MNLVRAAGRAMLATFFIANGVQALKEPDDLAEATDPVAEKVVPFARAAMPASVAAFVPEDTKTLVRLGGAVSIAGGLAMATGIAPRLGGGLAAASMVPQLIASNPVGAADKAGARSAFLRNLALAGAAIVLTQDTHGRPSLSWRAQQRAALASQNAAEAAEAAGEQVTQLSKRAQKKIDRAAREASKRLAIVAHDYDQLGRRAKKAFDRATSDAAQRLESAQEALR